MSCSYENCDFECYEDSDKCIFHCEKGDDWFTEKRKLWKIKKVKDFWQEIRNKRQEINNQFIGFIFPKFEKYECDFINISPPYHQTYNHTCLSSTNFGLFDYHFQYYPSIINTSFEKAVFLDDADFSKIFLKGSQNFTDAVFKKNIYFPSNNLSNLKFNSATFIQNVDFSNMTLSHCIFNNTKFKSHANFSQSNISNNVLFEECLFEDDLICINSNIVHAHFCKLIVKGKALFEGTIISSDAKFSECVFKKEFSFKNVDVVGEINFSKAIFKKEADFQGGIFHKDANFTETKFNADALFTQRTLLGNANFSKKVIIKGNALFNVKKIDGIADFSESVFKKDFSFKNVNVTDNTIFSKAIFFQEADFQGATFNGDALFINVEFNGDAIFMQSTFKKYADFRKIKVENKTNFSNTVFNNVEFNLSEFNNDVIFTKSKFDDSVNFSRITIKGQALLDIKHIKGTVRFRNSTFEDKFIFRGVDVEGKATFSKAIFKKEADFQGGIFGEAASFNGARFNSDAIFTQRKFKSNSIFNHVLANNLIFTQTHFFEKTPLDESNYNLDLSNGTYGVVTFKDTYLGQNITSKDSSFKTIDLNHSRFTKTSKVEFRNIQIDNLIFNKHVNESEEVLFDFVTVNNSLIIKHISFDEERFNHFDISKANVEIENSAFNNNFFNSVKWGTISEKRYSATRDIFRQLKFYSEQQKNFIDADGFYSLEMKEQKKELNNERKKLHTKLEKANHLIANSVIFYLHEKTSDFSQNWMLPLFWLLTIGMIGVIFQNFSKIDLQAFIPVTFSYLIFVGILPIAYKAIMKRKDIPKMMFYVLIFIPIVWVYLQVTSHFGDDIAKILNPSNIFKNVNLSETHEFISLFYKIIVLFLVYQLIVTIKKKVRSK